MGWRALLIFVAGALLSVSVTAAAPGKAKPPGGKALQKLVKAYIEADFGTREAMRKKWDKELAPLKPASLKKLRADLLKAAAKVGPKLETSGTNYLYEEKRGKYIVAGKPTKALFIGLHGGGAGSGAAESVGMGGGGWGWIYPEVIEKTEHGWTDSGTEEFVMELIEAAKRTWKIDPNRIYISGHSMGGYGSWTLGAHHADVFGGVGPYAGAPTCMKHKPSDKEFNEVQRGILPSYFNLPLHFFQSGDDKNVPPESNDFAIIKLREMKKRFPDGFNFRYDRVEGRGHAPPKEGYLPSQKWLASHPRVPRPRAFLWQPVLSWKRQMYWIYWARAEVEALVEFRADQSNQIAIKTHEHSSGDVTGMSVLLGEPLVDLTNEVVITVNGKQAFRGLVEHTFSTMMLTIPRHDRHLLFDASVDL